MAESVSTVSTDDPGPARPARDDRSVTRLLLVTALLALALIAGFGLGRGSAPVSPATPAAAPADPAVVPHTDPPGTAPHSHDGAPAGGAPAAAEVGGLAISAGGFTLVPERTTLAAGAAEMFRFRIDGPDGRPVTGFATVHDKLLHLIVARRDLSGYQHLHPVLAPDGTWAVELTLPSAGPWRVYADFTAVTTTTAVQRPVTLGVDLVVAGDYAPKALPAPAPAASTAGFEVRYEGTPRPGVTQPLLFRVSRDGAPAALQRYLAAYGHLVMLREGDLGYVHVHPEPELAGDAVKFWLAAPSSGRYRMFFDFQVAGAVHTAEFTVTLSAAGAPTPG